MLCIIVGKHSFLFQHSLLWLGISPIFESRRVFSLPASAVSLAVSPSSSSSRCLFPVIALVTRAPLVGIAISFATLLCFFGRFHCVPGELVRLFSFFFRGRGWETLLWGSRSWCCRWRHVNNREHGRRKATPNIFDDGWLTACWRRWASGRPRLLTCKAWEWWSGILKKELGVRFCYQRILGILARFVKYGFRILISEYW